MRYHNHGDKNDNDDNDEDEDEDEDELEDDVLEEDLEAGESGKSEELDPDDMPDFIFYGVDEADVVLEAEVEAIGVLHFHGDAKDRAGLFLGDWRAAAQDGAPEWYWVLHSGIGPGKLIFQRYSSEADEWRTVFSIPSSFESADEEKAARAMIRRVFGGYIPGLEETIEFGEF